MLLGSGGCSLYGGFKKQMGSSSFLRLSRSSPWGGGPAHRQVWVLVSLGVRDSCVPQDGTWLRQAQHKA